MVEMGIQLGEFGSAVVLQQMGVVTPLGHQFLHMLIQGRGREFAIGLLAQMEHGQTGGQVLVIRSLGADEIGGGPDQGLMDISRLHARIKLDMGAQLDLRNGDIVEPFGGPGHHTVDLVQIQRFCAAIALGDMQITVHSRTTPCF